MQGEYPVTSQNQERIASWRQSVRDILTKRDRRLLAIVGPCSIHDTDAALDYARRLKGLSDELSDRFFFIMRTYFEKPRTTVGWKGLILDPDLDGSYDIDKGLRKARRLLIDIVDMGLGPASAPAPPRARRTGTLQAASRSLWGSRTPHQAT